MEQKMQSSMLSTKCNLTLMQSLLEGNALKIISIMH